MRIWLYVFFCVSLLQEIAWHRLDDLQIANADFMSRGISGLKLYMVAPFLTWVSFDLHSLVSPHSCLLLFLLKYYKKILSDLLKDGFQHTRFMYLQD